MSSLSLPAGWVLLLEHRAPEIAVRAMRAASVRQLVVEADVDRATVVAIGEAHGVSNIEAAFQLTEALAYLWDDGAANADVGLELHVGALAVTVPGEYFTGDGPRRGRWKTMATTSIDAARP